MRFVEWVAAGSRSGVIHSGARLERGSLELLRRDGTTTVRSWQGADAPLLSGYFVIEANDLDAALAVAVSCPGPEQGTIEVREIAPGTKDD